MYVNARYRSYGQGGFVRYSDEVVKRLDGARVLEPPRFAANPIGGRVWEQVALMSHAKDGLLLSPANSGPLRHPCQVAVIHDVLALQRPDLVRGSFAALQKRFLPPLARSCKRVIVVSEAVADAVIEYCGVPRERIVCSPPGVSAVFSRGDRHTARRRLGLHPDRPVVGAVVSSAPRKNGAETLAVLTAVCEQVRGCQAVVAGADGARHVFGADSRPTSAAVVDLGQIGDEALADFYNSLDVMVFLSLGEGFGLPPVEAAACGAAIVSTSVPSVTECLAGAAWVVDGAQEATTAAVELLSCDDQRTRAVDASVDPVARLTWDRTARVVADVMHELEGALV